VAFSTTPWGEAIRLQFIFWAKNPWPFVRGVRKGKLKRQRSACANLGPPTVAWWVAHNVSAAVTARAASSSQDRAGACASIGSSAKHLTWARAGPDPSCRIAAEEAIIITKSAVDWSVVPFPRGKFGLITYRSKSFWSNS
jgi:hypothetical protein